MPRHEKSQKSPKKFLNFYRFAFGPQHPASHGVLTCLLYLSNEYIIFSDCVIGYLHRGTEKLCEFRKPNQNIPYFDRLDYVSIIFCEHSYVLSFEALFNGNIQLKQSMLWWFFLS